MQAPALEAPHRRPTRQYAFRRRMDRQRMAQRLATGTAPAEVAAIERLAPEDLATLLADDGFERLVRHYAELAALDRPARLARLADEALLLLELGIAAGDLRVAAFVVQERRAGRDPSFTLATKVDEMIAAAGDRPAAPPEVGERTAVRDRAAPRREADFAYCAATLERPDQAVALAQSEVRCVEQRLAGTGRELIRQLVTELERVGTAEPGGLAAAAPVIAFARAAHALPAACFGAASHLADRRADFAAARPPGMHRAVPGRPHDPG